MSRFSAYKYPSAAHTVQFNLVRNAGELTYQNESWTTRKKVSTGILSESLYGVSVSASVRIFLSLHDNKRAQSVLHTQCERGRQPASQSARQSNQYLLWHRTYDQ